jgi:hypothetical protein
MSLWVNRVEDDPGERTARVRNAPESGRRFNLPWLSRSGRQHGEKVTLVYDVAAPSQLGAVVDDAPDPRADQRPAADGIGTHQLADRQCERDVGAERAVDVPRRVVGGRRVGGPKGYAPQTVSSVPTMPRKRSTSLGCTTTAEWTWGATVGWLKKMS